MTDPLKLFCRLIDEGLTQADGAAIDEIVSHDFVEHQFAPPSTPGLQVGPAGVKAVVAALHRGAEDFRLTVDDAVVRGDTVWARLSGTGTDTGGQLGHPPTHRPFAITVLDIVRFVDDRAVEHWGYPTGSRSWSNSGCCLPVSTGPRNADFCRRSGNGGWGQSNVGRDAGSSDTYRISSRVERARTGGSASSLRRG